MIRKTERWVAKEKCVSEGFNKLKRKRTESVAEENVDE